MPPKPKKPKAKQPGGPPTSSPPPAPIPDAVPVVPPAASPGLPLPRRSWTEFGGKLPKNKERRELLEDGLNRALELVPPNLRARFIEVLTDVRTIQWKWATKSTKSVRILGKFRTGYSADSRVLDRLMMHGSREATAEWLPWHAENTKVLKDLIRRKSAGEITQLEVSSEYRAWLSLNPEPEIFRLATADEFAGTLIHELTHGIDAQAGENIFRKYGITKIWQKDGMQAQWAKAYYRGEVTITGNLVQPHAGAVKDPLFAYGMTKPVEGLAEAVRMYFSGTIKSDAAGGRVLSGVQWRAEYPELAGWVERVILGGG